MGTKQIISQKSFHMRKIILFIVAVALLLPIAVFAAAPVFTQTGPFQITENSSTGTLVGTVVATEATTYQILSGNGTGSGAFSIDNGGNIRVADGTQLDFETTPQFILQVAAGNVDGTTQASVTINVLNVNDPPKFDDPSYAFSLNENEANGTLVGTVTAADNDPADTIVYTILLATPPGIFSVDSDDGQVRIADTSQIDFESGTTEYTIFIQASDGGLTDVVPVTITIDDANDPPVAVDDGTYNGTEDTDLVVSLIANGVLANDTDQDLDVLTAVLDTQATNGSVTLDASGTFTYTPNAQYNGPDSFTYYANDGQANSNVATVTIDVAGNNDAPVGNDDNAWSTNEDTQLAIPATGVLANDSDPENDALTVSGSDATSTSGAAVSVAADGSFTYDPTGSATLQALDDGDAPQDTFTYIVSDGVLTDTATVSITVNGVNDAPTATDDPSYGTDEDTILNINAATGVLSNDSDIDTGDSLTVSAFDATSSNGAAVSVAADGSFSYDPTSSATLQALTTGDPSIADTFSYTITDGDLTDTATVTVTVTAVNDPPSAVDDTPTVAEDSSNNALDVLSNDSALPDTGEVLTITAVGTTNNGGTATNNGGTNVLYTPALNFFGTEVFTYTIGDGNSGFDTATVTVTVQSNNDAPIITEGISTTVDMDEDGSPTAFSLTLNATDVDSSTLTWSISSAATNGTATATGTGLSKSIAYTPNTNYNGTDSFVVQVDDGDGDIDTITVYVNIAEQNDDPTANDDFPTVDEQSVDNILTVLSNDSDAPDNIGETLTITAVGATDNGGTALSNGTTITYTPLSTYIGTEVFTYTIGDGRGGFATATVSVNVQDVNFDPVISEGISTTVGMDEDGNPTPFSLTLNATDVDAGDTLTWSIFTQGANGTATASGTGLSKSIGYTPNSDYNGTDSFVVQVADGNGGTDMITVYVNIAPQNDPPDALDDTPTVSEDSVNNALDVLNNDTIAPDTGETLTITAVGSTNNGGTASNNGIDITYTPATNFSGTEVFTYTISDGSSLSDTATVTVTVTPANDDPIITEGISTTVTMDEDGAPTPFALTLNATDVDSGTLTWSISLPASNGTATATGTGLSKSISYTPTANYNGTDSFVVMVDDGSGGTDTITVNVTITAVNDDPDAVDDNATTPQDTAVAINVLSNDSDIENDTLTVSSVTNGSNGTVANLGTSVVYTPTTGYEGPDSFTYTISDGNGGSDTATVTVTVGRNYIYLPMVVKPGPQAPDLVITSLAATSSTVEVVLTNQGPVDTAAGFWVDFYVAPSSVPTAANQLWQDVSSEGIAWGITEPIVAGESLTLTYSTAPGAPNLYFSAADSNFTGTLSAGTSIYAQVDSAHVSNVNGAILETHEILGTAYNNVSNEQFSTTTILNSVGTTSLPAVQSINASFALPLR